MLQTLNLTKIVSLNNLNVITPAVSSLFTALSMQERAFHCTPTNSKSVTARYKPTRDRSKPLTYEMANGPHRIAHRKAWNSWNTCEYISLLIVCNRHL